MERNLYDLSHDERVERGIEQLPETLGEAIEEFAEVRIVSGRLGDHIFERYVELKREEWEEYRIQVLRGSWSATWRSLDPGFGALPRPSPFPRRAAPTSRWWAPSWPGRGSSGWRRSRPATPGRPSRWSCRGVGPCRPLGALRALRGGAAGRRQARAARRRDRRGADLLRRPGPRCRAAARQGQDDAGEYLHVAAIAALTEVAVAEARDETEQSLRADLPRGAAHADDLEAEDVVRRGRRLGCDLAGGAVALVRRAPARGTPGRLVAASPQSGRARSRRRSTGRVYALVPGTWTKPAGRHAPGAARPPWASSTLLRTRPNSRRALEEAELVLKVTATGARPRARVSAESTYRLLFHVLASSPEEIELLRGHVAPLVAYDEQYSTDLIGHPRGLPRPQLQHERTPRQAIHAHRHTVSYRLDRMRELTGLDPCTPRTASGWASA